MPLQRGGWAGVLWRAGGRHVDGDGCRDPASGEVAEAEYDLYHNGTVYLTEAEYQAVTDEREIIQFQPI